MEAFISYAHGIFLESILCFAKLYKMDTWAVQTRKQNQVHFLSQSSGMLSIIQPHIARERMRAFDIKGFEAENKWAGIGMIVEGVYKLDVES